MEAATPLRLAHVAVTGDSLHIADLTVEDETAARVVREGGDPESVVRDAIEIGARVLDREQTAADAEFVKNEFGKVSKDVEAAFTERAREVGEQLATQFGEVFDPERGSLAKALEETFGDGSTGAVQHKVKAQVAELLIHQREAIAKQFSSADGTNPLADFKAGTLAALERAEKRQSDTQRALFAHLEELKRELQGLRDEKQKLEEVAAERERGTAKGRSYEEAVALAVDAIATPQGDVAEPVGDDSGAGGKKGDVLSHLDAASGPARGTIVFEAKDRRLTKPKFCEELDAAMAQRDAGFGVLVVPSAEEVPAKLHSLREYEGDKIIAVYDPEEGSVLELAYAYKVARVRVAGAADDGAEIDAAAVRATLQRAAAALDEVRKIKSQLTQAETAIGNGRTLVDGMADRVRAELATVDELLAAAAEVD